jgi:copper chaperone CopZ
MTFATTKQIIMMTIVWAVALCGIDLAKHPRSASDFFTSNQAMMGEPSKDGKPVIRLAMNHLCCTGCLGDVTKALSAVPGITVKEVPLPSQEAADEQAAKAGADYSQTLELEVKDLRFVDFVAIDRALRDAGLVADRIELSGPQHFRLEAELPHMCCGLCSTGVKDGLQMVKGLKAEHHFKWLDSFDVDKKKKLVIAHARYDATADVAEFIAALNRVGFQPKSLHAETTHEGGGGATGN